MLNNNGINRIYVVGNLLENAINNVSSSHADVVQFPLLITESYVKQGVKKEFEQVFDIMIPRSALYTNIENFVKGRMIHLEGRIQTHSVIDQQGTKSYITQILAHKYSFLN
ncbi:single-stranded DNA-binding protein [Mucilaginibacter robiniae]|uniref:Single-stranded DNA-binding protein n=1 Tax=Mucilaginibacter robiniae TaxID=2728022 RepID=A0A7L5DUN7_9SPHI|nr:single-stranded DNA-binding protein [Mucilaginibacter robiniae]QJD94421.1 single-stranded DNA-binding protein [Mucilaginibacter robiniae]